MNPARFSSHAGVVRWKLGKESVSAPTMRYLIFSLAKSCKSSIESEFIRWALVECMMKDRHLHTAAILVEGGRLCQNAKSKSRLDSPILPSFVMVTCRGFIR